MIFVTIGTHPGQFDRLIKRIDEIAPHIKEKIIIQTGFTKYVPKNVEHFVFAESLEPYFRDARLVISHSATSLLEFVLSNKKPIITVPRQKKFGEHINDHQVEFAEALHLRTGIKVILNIQDITPQLLKEYKTVPIIKKDNLVKLQSFFKKIFKEIENEQRK
ncbi:beta-1,4-galactosyltransferase [Candidatus Pacearchaeota archaeon]|nr:beta-1,4-galactosyltransferase [Candidatus Pacearchaeota archaeon]